MTISMLLMILAVATGAGTGHLIGTGSTPAHLTGPRGIAGECYVNGVWTNPCPSTPEHPPRPDPRYPEMQQ